MSLNGTLKALSDPIRRNILTMLKGKKMIAGDIAEELGISPASLSYHLNLLKKNDLVIESKEKNYVYAHLNIGKKELLRPQILVSLAGRVAGVRKENIGDIVIRKSGTDLEITRQGFNYLMKLQGHEYNGTIIKVSKVKSM